MQEATDTNPFTNRARRRYDAPVFGVLPTFKQPKKLSRLSNKNLHPPALRYRPEFGPTKAPRVREPLLTTIHSRLGAVLLLAAALLRPMWAEQIPVRFTEGAVRGFLSLRNGKGELLASGDLIQVVRGDKVTAELIFHFKDGSVDSETFVFSQRGQFRLLSDHHVQKGPSFPNPMDVSIRVSTGEVKVQSIEDGKTRIESGHLDLPPDLANGLVLTLLKNLQPGRTETKVSYVAAVPKPRLVKLAIRPAGEDVLTLAGSTQRATHFIIKVELGGVAGMVAPMIGKQPQDMHVWFLSGKVPAFVKMEGPLYQGGPTWRIELASPVWP